MKLEATPFYAVGLAVLFAIGWWFDSRSGHTFEEPNAKQFCKPQLQEGTFLWGRDAALMEPEEFEPHMLVRYRTVRSLDEVTSRIVATQGERVKIEAGKVLVNGAAFKDTYGHRKGPKDHLPELIVPEGCVFVLNDQRGRGGGDRKDSRTFGPISVRAISLCFSPQDPKQGSRR